MGLVSRLAPLVLVGVSLILLAAAVSGGGVAPAFEPTQGDLTSGGLLPSDAGSGLTAAGSEGVSPPGGGDAPSPGGSDANTQPGDSTSDAPTTEAQSGAAGARTRAAASAIHAGLTADPQLRDTVQAARQGETATQQLTAALNRSLANGSLNDAFRTAAANGGLTTPATGTELGERTVRKRLANDTARGALAATMAAELTRGELAPTSTTNATAAPSVRTVNASLHDGTLGQAVGESLSPAGAMRRVDSHTAAAFAKTLTQGATGDELARAFDATDSVQQRDAAIANSDTQAALTKALTTGSLGKAVGTHGDSTAAAETAAALTTELQSGSLGRSLYTQYTESGGFSDSAATAAAMGSPTLAGLSGAASTTASSGARGQDGATGGAGASQSPTGSRTPPDGTGGSSSTSAGSQSAGDTTRSETGASGTPDGRGSPSAESATPSPSVDGLLGGSGGSASTGGGLMSEVSDTNPLSDAGLSTQTTLAVLAGVLALGLAWAHRRYGISRASLSQFRRWLVAWLRQTVQRLRDGLVQFVSLLRQSGPWLWAQLQTGVTSLATAVSILLSIPVRLLAALAGIGSLLTPRRLSTGTRSNESESATASSSAAADDAVTRSAIQQLWREFLSAINPPNSAYKTPGEIGRYAIQRGVPSRPVQYIVAKYRQVAYAPPSVTDVDTESVADAVSTVKTAVTTSGGETTESEGDDGT